MNFSSGAELDLLYLQDSFAQVNLYSAFRMDTLVSS